VDKNIRPEQLQKAADYFLVTRKLVFGGFAVLFFGAAAVAWGIILTIFYGRLNIILIVIGVILIVEAAWARIAPSPVHLILVGLALLTVGISIIVVSIMNVAVRHTEAMQTGGYMDIGSIGTGVVVCFMQIAWSIPFFIRYARFRGKSLEEPTQDNLRIVKGVAESIDGARWKKSDDIVVFFWGEYKWKARLSAESAAFVAGEMKDIIFAKKENVEIKDIGKVALGKTRKVLFKVGDRSGKGTISPVLLDRFERWKKSDGG